MDIEINEVQEIIKSLDGSGELSIKEEKYLKVAKLCVQLAAENAALKAVFIQKEIQSEAVDAFMETAVMDHDWNETSEWSWVENETDVIHAVLDALKPDTHTTDRIVAGIKADGVGEFIGLLQQHVDDGDFVGDEVAVIVGAIDCGKEFCEQLREGADK